MITSKHIEKIVAVIVAAAVVLCMLAAVFSDTLIETFGSSGITQQYESELFDTSKVISLNIIMDEDEWNEMLENAISEEYYQCDVEVNGTTFYNVGIRPKGNTSLSTIVNDPTTNRYSFKLEFDKYVDGQTCFGLDKLVLNNNYADATNMKEAVVYDMFAYLGADASLYNYADISVNGETWGVYLALEAVEDSFMLRNYGVSYGNLYKPDSMNFGGAGGMKDIDKEELDKVAEKFFGKTEETTADESQDTQSRQRKQAQNSQQSTDVSQLSGSSENLNPFGGSAPEQNGMTSLSSKTAQTPEGMENLQPPDGMKNFEMPQGGGMQNAPANGEMPSMPAGGEMPEIPENGGGMQMPSEENTQAQNPAESETQTPAEETTQSADSSQETQAQSPFEGGMPQMPENGEMPEMPEGFEMPENGEMPSMSGKGDMGGGRGGSGGGSDLNYTDDELDSYSSIWESEVNSTGESDHKRVVEALKNISEQTNVEDYLDVDNMVKYMAVHTFAVNLDSLSGSMTHNYYLYERSGKLNLLPWDYNLAFGGFSQGRSGSGATSTINFPIDTPFSSGISLEDRQIFAAILENEEYLAQYHEYLRMLCEEYVDGGRLSELYSRIRSQIDTLVENDPNAFYTYEEYDEAAELLMEVISLRAESIKGQLDGTIPSTNEGQTADSSALVDGSHIDLGVLGTMSTGGGGGMDKGGRRNEAASENQAESDLTNSADSSPFSPGMPDAAAELNPPSSDGDLQSVADGSESFPQGMMPSDNAKQSGGDSSAAEAETSSSTETAGESQQKRTDRNFGGAMPQNSSPSFDSNTLIWLGICLAAIILAILIAKFVFRRNKI